MTHDTNHPSFPQNAHDRNLAAGSQDPASNQDANERKESQATRLVKLAAKAELFHNVDHDGFASVTVNDHREVHKLQSKGFKQWLRAQYYARFKAAVNTQGIMEAVGILEARAVHEGPEMPVHVRVAEDQGAIYLDLANAQWQIVKITSTGWQVVDDPPVRFRRPKALLPLPTPASGGKLQELNDLLNVGAHEFILLVAWLLAAMRPRGPYPVLFLHGEQGSAKSTTARRLRSLVDPNAAMIRSEPKNAHDLMIAATNGRIICLDNVSRLPPWLSDALCRLATGGGFSTRTLYENDEETIFDVQRPVIVTGIEAVANQSDLLDRSLVVNLPAIAAERRRTEAELWQAFEMARPRLLGALLDAMVTGLRNLPTTRLDRLPRMADFAQWIIACEPGLPWKPGEFECAFGGSQQYANDLALEVSPCARTLMDWAASRESWRGTATALLAELNTVADDCTRKAKTWPKSAKALGGHLRRLAPNLRATGINLEFDRGNTAGRPRLIVIHKTREQNCVQTVQSVHDRGIAADKVVDLGGELDVADVLDARNREMAEGSEGQS